jgi:peroxiredoxin
MISLRFLKRVFPASGATLLAATLMRQAAGAADAPATLPAGQTPAPAPAPAVTATTPTTNGPMQKLETLIKGVNTKLTTGAIKSEADAAEDFKKFDQLLAEYSKEKTDEVAQILYMKAVLYLQVFQNLAKGKEALIRLKTDFPKTKFAPAADQMLVNVNSVLTQMENMQRMQEESRKQQESLGIVIGKKFPDFSGTDIAGQPISLAKHKGKVVLVDFWATWCGPCVGELPNVLAAYEKHHPNGFEIVAISRDQDEARLKSFIEEKKMPWQQYFDGRDNKMSEKYGIALIPTTFLLDGTGTLIARDLRGPELEKAVAEALAKK